MSLDAFTMEQLEAELEGRRQKELEDEKPKPVANPDYAPMTKLCQRRIDEVANGIYDADTSHYIYEAAMKAVFGNVVFDFINKRMCHE